MFDTKLTKDFHYSCRPPLDVSYGDAILYMSSVALTCLHSEKF